MMTSAATFLTRVGMLKKYHKINNTQSNNGKNKYHIQRWKHKKKIKMSMQ